MMMTVITNNRLALGTLRQASKVTRCTAARQSRGSSGWALVEQRCHGTYLWKFFRNQGTWLGFELRSKPNIVIKVGTVERTPWTMRAQDGTVRFLYLAAKTSPSFYPCHWVSQWVLSDLLTPAIASTKLCDLVFKAKISFNIFLLIW